MKTKEYLIDMLKEQSRNKNSEFIRIFPSELISKYEPFLEKSSNLPIYKQLNSVLFTNRILNYQVLNRISPTMLSEIKSPV